MSTLADVLPVEALEDVGSAPELPGADATVDAFVRPLDVAEVARAVRWALEDGRCVVPVGTGRHLHRMAVPRRCVVLSTSRMRGVETYEPADLTLTAGAGTPIAELTEALAPHDQWLPFDPPDAESRTLGGLVASGLSGPLGTGYGTLRNHVLGATVVRGDGRALRLGGRVVKNVAGFDLLRPMVGSRGGLGVLTSVCVRVFPVPQADRLLVARADDPEQLVAAARAVATAPLLPASLVLVAGVEGHGGAAALLVRLHGARATVDADQATLERCIGSGLEVLEGEDARVLVRAARDHPAASGIGLASVLPACLGPALEAVRASVGSVDLAADASAGSIRFAFPAEAASGLAGLREALEGLGGSLGLERFPADLELRREDVVTPPGPGEVALAERVRAAFDPSGVYWPSTSRAAKSSVVGVG
ncbi:MAG: FAD-binding oxidoreductase [Gemmatimonadota bacterium]|nr:FAD-binding oxidoreductase [Gemmatimonadota bacterium]